MTLIEQQRSMGNPEAALASEEGSVWPAGGKLIFSAFDRTPGRTSVPLESLFPNPL